MRDKEREREMETDLLSLNVMAGGQGIFIASSNAPSSNRFCSESLRCFIPAFVQGRGQRN